MFDSIGCSRSAASALRRLVAGGATGPAVALCGPGDLPLLAATELARHVVPASCWDLDIHVASPEQDRWSADEVREKIAGPARLVAMQRSVIVVENAAAMEQTVADQLLKLLEEPASGSLFVLCAQDPDELSVTIRSRLAVVMSLDAAPLAERLGALLGAGMAHSDAQDLLSCAAGSHAVVAFVLADVSRAALVRDALGAELLGDHPAGRARRIVGALENLAKEMCAADGVKATETVVRARVRGLLRAAVGRWRTELQQALRNGAQPTQISIAAAALDELEAALWRYRPALAALANAMVQTDRA